MTIYEYVVRLYNFANYAAMNGRYEQARSTRRFAKEVFATGKFRP